MAHRSEVNKLIKLFQFKKKREKEKKEKSLLKADDREWLSMELIRQEGL